MLNTIKLTLLDTNWNVLKTIKRKHLPRTGELIHINTYYRVINVIHDINHKDTFFIIIEELNESIEN